MTSCDAQQAVKRIVTFVVLAGALALGVLAGHRPAGTFAPAPSGDVTEVPLSSPAPSDAAPPSPRQPQHAAELTFEETASQLELALAEARPARRQEALFRIRRAVLLADIPRVLALLTKRQQFGVVTLAGHLAGRWSEVDPQAALAYVAALPPSCVRNEALRTILGEWTVSDPAACVKWVDALPPGKEKDAHSVTVFYSMAAQDPRRALALATSLRGIQAKPQLYATILRRWAESNPPAAARAAVKLEGLPGDLWGELAYLWAWSVPEAAVNWVDHLPSPQDRLSALRRLVSAWANHHPGVAAAFAVSREAAGNHPGLLEPVLAQWVALDPAAALRWASNLAAGPVRDRALATALRDWAEADPRAALRQAIDEAVDRAHPDILGEIGARWAEADPEAALLWVKAQSVSVQRGFGAALFLASPADGWLRLGAAAFPGRKPPELSAFVSDDPGQAAELVNWLDPAVQGSLAWCLAGAWGRQDLAGALDWAKALPNGQNKDLAFGGLVREWARDDPQAAADYALKAMPSAGSRRVLLPAIIGAWGAASPTEAAAWLEKVDDPQAGAQMLPSLLTGWCSFSPAEAATYAAGMPEGPDQKRAVAVVAGAWAAADPEAAGDWVGSFPAGDVRRGAVSSVAQAWALQDGAAAAGWILSLGDSDDLRQTLVSALNLWVARQGDTARAWIQNSQLPEAVTRQFLRPPPQGAPRG